VRARHIFVIIVAWTHYADYAWTYSPCTLIFEQYADGDEYARYYQMGSQRVGIFLRVFSDVTDMTAPVVFMLSPSANPLNATTILIAMSINKPDTIILGVNDRDTRCVQVLFCSRGTSFHFGSSFVCFKYFLCQLD
jgi:hypothetical protein